MLYTSFFAATFLLHGSLAAPASNDRRQLDGLGSSSGSDGLGSLGSLGGLGSSSGSDSGLGSLPFSIPSNPGAGFALPTGFPSISERSDRHARQLDGLGGLTLPTGGLPSFPLPSGFPESGALKRRQYAAPPSGFPAPSGLPFPPPFPLPSGAPFPIDPSGYPHHHHPQPTGYPLPQIEERAVADKKARREALVARSGDTENDVTSNTGCKALTVIFARGTTETGNVGSVAGPPMFTALKSTLGDGQVAVQGVDYDAGIEGNFEGGSDGGPTMVTLVKQALSQCPTTKIVLSGYSQGGFVVHYAAANGLTAAQISAVVIFGDPENGSAVTNVPASNLLEICASGDEVCQDPKTYAITPAHLTYGSDAQQAADFIVKTTGITAAAA